MTTLNTLPSAFHEIGWQLVAVVCFWLIVSGIVLLAIGVATGILLDGRYGWNFGSVIACFVGAIAILFGGGIDGGYLIVCGPQYMKDYRVEGTVTSVTNKLDTGTGDLTFTDTPVITLDSMEVPLQVDDPKALTLLDKDVTLVCYLGWNFRAHDDYYCKIVSYSNDAS